MLFNSIDFALFLPIVFILYWFTSKSNKGAQNVILIISSYVFYGWWDWRFLSLIFISTLTDFTIGRFLSRTAKRKNRKLLLGISILVNLGFLGFFKYYNFFLESFTSAFSLFGSELNSNSLNIILPVGISFYTFQTLSYTIDVYRKKLEPTKDIIAFFTFVSFFPQLVAGPIERATNLLPQFHQPRKFSNTQATDGIRQILWGLFKKIVIADNCAEFANIVFENPSDFSGFELIIGAIFFAFQIYGDFSGYSDIAIGTARLFGISLMRNFAFPYFSRDIAEFWRRWHISLSTWFRDYVYIPIGGNKGNIAFRVRNIFIVFTVSGFWHGANWTFIVWGILHAIFYIPLVLLNRNRLNLSVVSENRLLPSVREFLAIIFTFSATTIAWIFFRAESLEHAVTYIIGIFSHPFLPSNLIQQGAINTIYFLVVFLLLEWCGRHHQYAIQTFFTKSPRLIRWSFYYAILICIFVFSGKQQEFIYFQF